MGQYEGMIERMSCPKVASNSTAALRSETTGRNPHHPEPNGHKKTIPHIHQHVLVCMCIWCLRCWQVGTGKFRQISTFSTCSPCSTHSLFSTSSPFACSPVSTCNHLVLLAHCSPISICSPFSLSVQSVLAVCLVLVAHFVLQYIILAVHLVLAANSSSSKLAWCTSGKFPDDTNQQADTYIHNSLSCTH